MPKKSEEKIVKKSPSKKGKEKNDVKETPKKLSLQEYEKKILSLADTGLTSEKIGEALRKEGIHPKEQEKKISKILKEKEKYTNPDLKNLEEKLQKLREHYEKNKQDKKAMRDRDKTFSQIRKLKKYHKLPLK